MRRGDHPEGELVWDGLRVKTQADDETYHLYLDWRYAFQYAYEISLCQSACRDCGSTLNIIAHHPNYSLPGLLIWLCQDCHLHRHWHIVHGGEELVHADGRSESSLTDEERWMREVEWDVGYTRPIHREDYGERLISIK